MHEVIHGRHATYFPYARQRKAGGFWEGAVDIVTDQGKTVHVCDEVHEDSGDALIDAIVDALVMANGA